MSATTLPSTFTLEDASGWHMERFPAESQDTVAKILPDAVERKVDNLVPPPNGGTKAWLQVLGSWMLFFNTWGILNTFGVFQTYYESGELFKTSSSNISWIGSIQALTMLATGAFVGPIYDRGGFRWLLIVGSIGVVVGHMLLSLAKKYWEAILTQGFMVGFGGGCLYVPAVAIMPTYFTSKLGLALGIAASGSSTGGIIYPIMFYKLIDRVGFGWSVRILGFTALTTLIIPFAVMEMRVKPAKVRSLIDWTAFRDGPYMMFVAGCLIGFTSCYIAFFYTSYFGQASGITDTSLSFYLVPILNAGSVFGRTVPNWLSDKIGPFNVIAPSKSIIVKLSSSFLTSTRCIRRRNTPLLQHCRRKHCWHSRNNFIARLFHWCLRRSSASNLCCSH
jgi:MFS family permease